MLDLTASEALSMVPLMVLIVVIGVFPQTLVGVMQTSVEAIARLVAR
jgi:NADH:ubiquinone oxidoreductase subunit 4 (subunit M)